MDIEVGQLVKIHRLIERALVSQSGIVPVVSDMAGKRTRKFFNISLDLAQKISKQYAIKLEIKD